jgi:hypothetical protein
MIRPRRSAIIIACLALGVILLAAVGFRVAVERLHEAVTRSLGPRATIGALELSWSGLQALDVRIRAERGSRGWPAEDELRARRIHFVPALQSLWRSGWHVQRIDVEGAYVSALRSRDGRLRLLPSLLERPAPAGGKQGQGASPAIDIARVSFHDATLELHDATVRQPPHRLRIQQLRGHAGPLHLPTLDRAVEVQIEGALKGVQHDGRLKLSGTVTPATRDARLAARFDDVDLLALQPYLLRMADTGVRRGRLDLAIDATVAGNRLQAPGRLVIQGLELDPGSGFARFAGVSRQAVVAAMQRDGRIEVKFTLEGRLDDPSFSLNENLATRLASGLADTLGVSLGGVVEGVGNVVKGLFGR